MLSFFYHFLQPFSRQLTVLFILRGFPVLKFSLLRVETFGRFFLLYFLVPLMHPALFGSILQNCITRMINKDVFPLERDEILLKHTFACDNNNRPAAIGGLVLISNPLLPPFLPAKGKVNHLPTASIVFFSFLSVCVCVWWCRNFFGDDERWHRKDLTYKRLFRLSEPRTDRHKTLTRAGPAAFALRCGPSDIVGFLLRRTG